MKIVDVRKGRWLHISFSFVLSVDFVKDAEEHGLSGSRWIEGGKDLKCLLGDKDFRTIMLIELFVWRSWIWYGHRRQNNENHSTLLTLVPTPRPPITYPVLSCHTFPPKMLNISP